jgi:Sigma-70 region 2
MRKALRPSRLAPIALALLVSLVACGGYGNRSPAQPATPTLRSMAILPTTAAGRPIKKESMKQMSSEPMQRDWTEAEAIEAARHGDAAAFEFLYKKHCKHVYAVCLCMLKGQAEAEDLTRQAFLQAFRRIASFRGDAAFGTWLHRVTVNLALVYRRKNRRSETLCTSLDDEDAPGDGNLKLSSRGRFRPTRSISLT